MKGFGIEVKNDLLEKKHIEAMDVSLWLYLWCLDKVTSISEEGVGKVLGGKPITSEFVESEMGISERTYKRWLSTLRSNGYINTKRAPTGLILSVNKAHKRFKNRYAKNGTSHTKSGTSDMPESVHPNKTVTVDSNSMTIPIEQSSKEISEIIDLFKGVNPSYRKLFGSPPQRKASARLLETFGMEKIRKIVALLPRSNAMEYMPVITTPCQLEDKMGSLAAGWQKVKNREPVIL